MFIVPPEWFERIFDIPQEDQDAHQAELENMHCFIKRAQDATNCPGALKKLWVAVGVCEW